MRWTMMIGAAALSGLLVGQLANPLAAADFGTPQEARAMLDKAVVAIKADKASALAQFNKGEGGFKDRDLYPFCAGSDGMFTAHPVLNGKSLADLADKNGKALGKEILSVAEEGKVKEVDYMWPRPGSDPTPVAKVSFVTKIGDQTCAVGYYK
jgi:signal transduction histidine kinase